MIISDDDLISIENDDLPPTSTAAGGKSWKILIVDDDEDVHQATELALRGLLVEARPVRLLHAHSGIQARELIAADEDIAVMLLDVVMESDDAGLRLVRHCRKHLGRHALRIILRTGQPGYAPELETISSYDINDYKTKSELTRIRLFTCLTTAVRAYAQMRALEEMRGGLEKVVKACTDLTKLHGMQLFAQGVVSQLCVLLGTEPEGLICAQAGLESRDEPARVIAAAGRFSHLVHQPLHTLGLPQVQQALESCLSERRNQFEPGLSLYFATESGRGLAAFVDLRRELQPLDRHLLEVFCSSMSVGFENVLLYARLVDQAYLDPLLRIPNLNRLRELLAGAMFESAENTLAVLDIDNFSAINDTLGHDFGNAVLGAVARRLGEQLAHSRIARVGSDVFGVLGPASEVEPGRLQRVFTDSFDALGQSVRVCATMGLVRLKMEQGRSAGDLLKDVHVALKQAKSCRRGAAVYFSEAMGQDARQRMHLLSDLREAFENQQLFLAYQPKLDLSDGRPHGVEALLRWRRADGEFVPPDRFIPLAEQSGLMLLLGGFVLRTACHQLSRLRAAGYRELSMAINVSQAQLREQGFTGLLCRAIAEAGVPPASIELEITESMAADDLDLISRLMAEISEIGVKVAIDDFGTGFSSLSVLRHLRASRLKIDRSFVEELERDSSIARMVIGLGHGLGMSITAEGVETPAQRAILSELGCDEGQGWLFARALDEPALLAWLHERR